jgi:hypothetical protein
MRDTPPGVPVKRGETRGSAMKRAPLDAPWDTLNAWISAVNVLVSIRFCTCVSSAGTACVNLAEHAGVLTTVKDEARYARAGLRPSLTSAGRAAADCATIVR